MTVTPEQLQQIRNYTQQVQLNDFVRVCSLVNLLCDEIEILNGVVDQKTDDFFKGVKHETEHESSRISSDSIPPALPQQNGVATTGYVSTPSQDRDQGISVGAFPETKDVSTVTTNDFRKNERSEADLEPRRETEEMGGEVREPLRTSARDSSESNPAGLTRNQRRRIKRQRRKGKK